MATKTYPDNYPIEAVRILEAMSFGNVQLVGSMSLRNQLYAHDYDGYENVVVHYPTEAKAVKHLVKRFQSNIKRLQRLPFVIIADIKSGSIEEWKVVPEKRSEWNAEEAKEKIRSLEEQGIIDDDEAKEAIALCTPNTKGYILAKDNIKFNTVRWTPKEALRGHKTLRDGRRYTLEEAFQAPAITKLDTIGWVQHHYTDFSVIYQFFNGKTVINNFTMDPVLGLKESIYALQLEDNHFKVLKRLYSLAKLRNNQTVMSRLTDLLNSDLGRLYSIISDLGTLIDHYDVHPPTRIRESIDSIKTRLGNVSLAEYLKGEISIIRLLDAAAARPRSALNNLKTVEERLKGILNSNTPRLKSLRSASRIIRETDA